MYCVLYFAALCSSNIHCLRLTCLLLPEKCWFVGLRHVISIARYSFWLKPGNTENPIFGPLILLPVAPFLSPGFAGFVY
jgi:hypothetical protein